jgi:hypothetical protein
MKTYFNKLLLAAGLAAFFTVTALADVDPSNKKVFGDNTTSEKVIEAKRGSGASNPKIRVNSSTGKWQFMDDSGAYQNFGSGSGGSSGGGVVLNGNPGFEEGTTNWSASGGSFTINTSLANVGFGLQSGAWDASATSQTLSGRLLRFPRDYSDKSVQ